MSAVSSSERSPGATTFEIGLVMAGAVSAGAYTAGVMDFLIQALDTWYAAKEREAFAKGNEWSQWTVPPHNVEIKVISGTSAGGMTAALVAAALCEDFQPIDGDRPPRLREVNNKLYSSWVLDVDIRPMLSNSDLRESNAPLRSLLNCQLLDRVASEAINVRWRGRSRPYIADAMPLFLCVTNLRGLPYSIQFEGSAGAEHEMSAHADHVSFALVKPEARNRVTVPDTMTVLRPDRSVDDGWRALAQSALASGAFPMALAPRFLERAPEVYEKRQWMIPRDTAVLEEGRYVCQEPSPIPPDWADRRPDSYAFLCVDGGVMNNEPLELARRWLAGERLRNERAGEKASRAVVMIDPFPNRVKFDRTYVADSDPVSVAAGVFKSLSAQASFKLEELKLAREPNVFSRFVIAPTRRRLRGTGDEREPHALACGALGNFSGFLSEEFRRHDFLLGRRNCQQFLRRHFALPAENPLFDDWPEEMKNDARYSFSRGSEKMLPIIPLVNGLERELRQPDWPRMSRDDLDSLKRPAERRANLVVDRLLKSYVRNRVLRCIARTIWRFKRRDVLERLMNTVRADLEKRGLLA